MNADERGGRTTSSSAEFLSRRRTNERSILPLLQREVDPRTAGVALASAFAAVRAYSLEKSRRVGRVPRLLSERRHLEHASTDRLHYGLVISITPHTPTDRNRSARILSLSLYCEIHRVGVLGELFSNVCNLLAEQ